MRPKHIVERLFFAGLSCLSSLAIADSGIVEREFAVPAAGGTIEYITQKSFRNSNGTFTLVAGQRSDQQKRIHAERCASVGGKDVFDESLITVSEDVADVTVCQTEDGLGNDATMIEKNQSQVITSSSLTYGNHYFPPAITLVPPNRNVPVLTNYNLTNYMYYSTGSDGSGRYYMNMVADNCSMSTGGTIGSNVHRGKLTLFVTCISHTAGTWPVYLNGGIPGVSGTAVGEIRASN